jgi:FkbM family methyltransferase
MNPLRFVERPEYFFRPRQVWRRLRRNSLIARNAVELAWGLPIEVVPSHVGIDVLNLGVCDPVVPESIFRLLDPGEIAIDAGANIGQNTAIMALAAGPRGSVIAFEPAVAAGNILARNVARWSRYDLAPITVERKALSARNGIGTLRAAADLGGYSLEEESPEPKTGAAAEVELTTLDSYFASELQVGVIKIDVEGHEQAVLEGSRRLLRERRIRDIVFEDFQPQPSPVTHLLRSHGYTVFSLLMEWRGPVLLSAEAAPYLNGRPGGPPNYLATIDSGRAAARFARRGWKCLRIHARHKLAVGSAR